MYIVEAGRRGGHTWLCIKIRNRLFCSVFRVAFTQLVLKVRCAPPTMPLACVHPVVTVTVNKSCSYSKL